MPTFKDYLATISNQKICQLLKNVWEKYLVHLENSDFNSCFECCELLLDNCPQIADYLENELLELLSRWNDFVVNNSRDDQIKTVIRAHVVAVRYCRNADLFFNSCGNLFFRLKKFLDAKIYFEESKSLNVHNLEIQENLDNLNSMLVDRWHFPMLNDKTRNFGYGHAIRRQIRELKMKRSKFACLDIGAGTGLLSMYIASAVDELSADGVKIVSCELDECMFKVAQEVLQLNGLKERINLIHSSSNSFSALPGCHDDTSLAMVVTETFDAGLLGEGVLESMDHVHRVLKSPNVDLKVIPNAATVYMRLLQSEDVRNYSRYRGQNKFLPSEIRIFCNVGQADDDDDDDHEFLWQPYTCEKISSLRKNWKSLSESVALGTINFESHESIKRHMDGVTTSLSIKVMDGGSLDAMVVWFDLHLDDECDVTTSPFNSQGQSSCWQQAVYPIFNVVGDLTAKIGDIVNIECCIKDLIRLKCVGINSSPLPSPTPNTITYHLPPSSVAFLNNFDYHDKCLEALEKVFVERDQHSLGLVIASRSDSQSGLIVALWCLRNGVRVKFVVSEDDNKDYDDGVSGVTEVSKIIKDVAMFERLDSNLISFKNTAHDDDDRMSADDDHERNDDNKVKWMAGFVDFIESSGSMRSDCFRNLLKVRRHLSMDQKMIPSKMHCVALLVDSRSILADSKVVSDESTSPYKVAEVINKFKTSYHMNFCLDSHPHTKLTPPFHLFTFNTDHDNQSDNPFSKRCRCKVQSIADGTIAALVYWFRIELMDGLNDGLMVDTLNGHWKQSSIILNPLHVSKSSEFFVDVECRSGYFSVHVTME